MATRVAPGLGPGVKKGSVSPDATLQTGLANSNFYLPFFHYLTIPKNTAITSFVSYILPLPISQSERLWIEFPKGCAGLVGVQLWRGVEQIFPLPAGNWFKSDGHTFDFRFTHWFDREPYEVEIRGYNLDDTYQHTPWIGLELRGLPGDVPPQLQGFIQFIMEG